MRHEDKLWGALNNPDLTLERAQVAIVGIPFDSATSHRRGAAFAPDTIREASRAYHPLTENFMGLSELRVKDLGDVDVDPMDLRCTYENIDRQIQDIVHAGATPVVLGGDHSITFPVVRSLVTHHSPFHNHHWTNGDGYRPAMGIVWFDAHPDLMPIYRGSKYSHACPLRRILELEQINPERVVMMGTRKVEPEEWEFMQEMGICYLHASQVAQWAAAETAARIRDRLGDVGRLYWSFDIDVLDPAFAPGTGVPTPGGLTTRQLLDLLHALSDLPVSGVDIVEVSPPFDHSDITAFAAAALVMEMLGKAKVAQGKPKGGGTQLERREGHAIMQVEAR